MAERNILITISANNPVPSGYKALTSTKDGKVIAVQKDSLELTKA